MENHGTSGEASAPETHPDVQPSEGGLLMAPTRKMPEELSPLTDYLTDLTEQEWVAFSQATADPVTKAQFLKLCVNLVQHVTMSSMNAVVPALIKLLTVDPQQFLTCPETHYCLLDLETAGPSLRWSDEGRHITVLNNAMLMKASTEGSSGQTQEVTRTPDSRRSAEERSQQISLLDQFGITEEGIRQSVQATLKELNVVGCPSATEELTHSIVREAMVWVNTSLAEFKKAASSEPGSSALHEIFNAEEEFVEKVSIKLDSRRSAEDARQSLLCWKRCSDACPSEEDLDPVLSSTVSDSMTVIIDTIESSLNEQDEDDCKNKPAKNLFSSIRQAVKAFACQSASLSEVSFYDEENQGDHIECISQVTLDSLFSSAVQPGKRPFSFDDFRLKANKAVRSVLVIKMKNFDSVPPSYTHVCATDTPASVDAPRSKTEHSPEPYWKPVEEAASLVIENFVEEIKAIAQSAECVDENEETAVETQPDDASSIEKMEPNAEKNPALLAAKKIFAKVQKTLKDFFIQLPTELHLHQAISAPSSDEVSDQNPQEPGEDPTQDFTQMASCRNEQLPQARTVSHLQLHQVQSEAAQSGHSALSQPDLDTCTRNVLKGVIASYHKQKEAAQPEETSLDLSTTPNDYVRNVISQLSNITSSSIEDSLSIVCIQNLSSSTFQRNAFDAVVDVLVTSVQSNGTLRPFVSSDNIEESAEPENDTCASSPPQEAEIENANAAASEIVDQFEKDLRKCIESLQSLRITNQSDMGSMEPLGTLRSTKEIPKQEFTSAASKLYHSVQVKIYGLFMRSNNSTPRQCVSDSALLKHEHEKASGMLTTSEILQLYIEESVKHLFLPCFKLPSPWDGVKGGSQQQAQTSISCPSSLTDVASDAQGKMAATKSPPQILSDTVGLVVEMMVKEVMSGLTRALSPNSDLEAVEETSHSSNLGATKSFSSKLAEPQMSAGTSEGVQITPWPKAFPMDTDDYTGLVTILVVQLLTKINYGWFSYDMVSKAGELINKVVAAFSASSGISATEPYPEDIREHRIYRAVYSNLLTEFGSETDLLKAMESNRPSFQTSIVTSLTKELLQICDTQPVKGKGERGILQKLNIGGKNVPSQSRKQWHSSNKDQSALSTTAVIASANMSSSSETPLIEQSSRHSEKSRDARMPKKHRCFIKIFSALRGETS
ncbi:hypothetical protein AALO_G00102120 [Alosa alosa]|uniref:Fibrous sheath-interacting protein 2-like n=1 Tax=Alosa alosa TaxID=278164 RepID=A0AAV6GV49_9TELE|nr:hypothetical protein AALO_G00102120 [Alosa alosa]